MTITQDPYSQLSMMQPEEQRRAIALAKEEAYRREGKWSIRAKWLAIQACWLGCSGFLVGFAIAFLFHLVNSSAPNYLLVGGVAGVVSVSCWASVEERVRAWLLGEYIVKVLNDRELVVR